VCRWRNDSFEYAYTPAQILTYYDLISQLKACKALRDISIQFSNLYFPDGRSTTVNRHLLIPLKGFRNLRSINFFEQDAKVIKDLVKVLGAIPIFGNWDWERPVPSTSMTPANLSYSKANVTSWKALRPVWTLRASTATMGAGNSQTRVRHVSQTIHKLYQ